MALLAFTCSTRSNSVCIKTPQKVFSKPWTRSKASGEALTPNIEGLLREAHLQPKDLQRIGVDHGPGSFTGSRLATGVAKTFSYSLGIPLFSISSLDLMALEVASSSSENLLCLLNAHRSLSYCRWYKKKGNTWEPVSQVSALPDDEIVRKTPRDCLIIGEVPDGVLEKLENPSHTLLYPKAETLALAVENKHPFVSQIPWTNLEAKYVRAPDAVEKADIQP